MFYKYIEKVTGSLFLLEKLGFPVKENLRKLQIIVKPLKQANNGIIGMEGRGRHADYFFAIYLTLCKNLANKLRLFRQKEPIKTESQPVSEPDIPDNNRREL